MSDLSIDQAVPVHGKKELQFDIFGFSRGAAARHVANRIFSQDNASIAAIKAGLDGTEFSGTPGGKPAFWDIRYSSRYHPVLPKDDNLSLQPELNSLCKKAIVMGRA